MKKTFTLFAAIIISANIFGQAQRLVLFEEFTGENCPPCAYENPLINQLIAQYPSQVVLLKYQCDIPSPGALYYTDKTDVNSRKSYYGVSSAPWGEQDGTIWDPSLLVGANAPGYLPITWAQDPSYLTTESAITSPFTIDLTQTITGASDSFYAQVVITAAQDFTGGTYLKLRLAMIEDLLYPISEGHNGETQFPHVVRKMLPNPTGTSINSTWTNGQVQTFNFQGVLPSYIRDKSKIQFIAFVQNDANKDVEQAAISQPTVYNYDVSANEIYGTTLNCYNQYYPTFSFTNVGSQTITSGQFQISIDGNLVDSANWDGSSSPMATGDSNEVQLNPVTVPYGPHLITIAFASPNGQPDQNVFNNAASISVYVADSSSAVPIADDFESGFPANWVVQSNFVDNQWALSSVGYNSAHSLWIDFFDDLTSDLFYGATTSLYTPALDLSRARHAKISFDHAYSPIYFGNDQSGNEIFSNDSLFVEVSSDCGNTWQQAWGNGFVNLATININNVQGVAFVPTSADWVHDSADISSVALNDGVLLRFRAQFGQGNNLYIDNVNITDTDFLPSSVEQVKDENDFMQLYPNPTANTLNLNINMNSAAHLVYTITDVSGKLIHSEGINGSAGQNIYSVNTSALAAGTYFLTLNDNGKNTSKLFNVIH